MKDDTLLITMVIVFFLTGLFMGVIGMDQSYKRQMKSGQGVLVEGMVYDCALVGSEK